MPELDLGFVKNLEMAMEDDDWKKSSGENVYQMCVAHGGPGFWIRRTTWGGTCARIVGVGAMTMSGPYYGNPAMLMDVYSLDGTLKEELAQLPAAGTYKKWRMIDPPSWANAVNLRDLDDKSLKFALERFNGIYRKGSATKNDKADSDRILLAVSFAQKEEAKSLGARWDPAQKVWWLASDNISGIERARNLGFLSPVGTK